MRAAVGVFKSPLSSLFYFFTGVVPQKIGATFQWLSSHQSWVASALVVLFLYVAALIVEGPQQQVCICLTNISSKSTACVEPSPFCFSSLCLRHLPSCAFSLLGRASFLYLPQDVRLVGWTWYFIIYWPRYVI
jgi:hypothetical protein